jgi:glycerol-3-phosphate acyltransferase PlsX
VIDDMNNTEKKTFRIALDAMGGDYAPINEVHGAILALENKKKDQDFEIVLVGNKSKIDSALAQFDYNKNAFSILSADEVVTMDDDATAALKYKKNSSLYRGIEQLSQGYVDAFVSAGNTGATLSTATVLLGRISGVSRPTIGQFFPSQYDNPVLVLDVGANIECKARYLYEFAVMGSMYVTQILGLEDPRVGLLNIGEEETKGTEIIQSTYQLLKQSSLNFVGNVEGKDILMGNADVVVCDGLTGNIVMKFAESIFSFLKAKMKNFSRQSVFNLAAMALMKPLLKRFFSVFDYEKFGGVPILGVNGVVIIGHGKSSPKAIEQMIYKAYEFIKKDINHKIENALNPPIVSEQIKK